MIDDTEIFFEFCTAHLGGKITMLTTHGEQSASNKVPPDWRNASTSERQRSDASRVG